MSDLDLRLLKRLVRDLASNDAFARREAIERLAVLTQQRLDYRWSAEADERTRAIRRWKRWIAREERERRGRVQSTIQILSGGQIDKSALEAALQGLPPEQKKALMAKVLAKVTAHQAGSAPANAPCQTCERRPATVRVTQIERDGEIRLLLLCEVCVHRDGG